MSINRDDWLSDIFGYNVFRVSLRYPDAGEDLNVVDPGLLASRLSQVDHALYYAKVPTQRIDVVQTLCSVGFSIVDVNVVLARRPTRQCNNIKGNSLVVQDILSAHYEAVLHIAASCFVYSRFHLDPAIPNEIANAIKRAWIGSYIRGTRGERLLVGLLDGQPVGFLAVLAMAGNGKLCRVIDLIGVEKAYQGRGIGRALVSYGMQQDVENCSLWRVGTQVANIPSMRLYESMGFRMDETSYVLHAHVGVDAWHDAEQCR